MWTVDARRRYAWTRRKAGLRLTDQEWAILKPLLPHQASMGRPWKHTRRTLFDAIPGAPVADGDEILVIPVTGYLDEDGVGQVKDRPPQHVIDEVSAAIAAFGPAARSGLN